MDKGNKRVSKHLSYLLRHGGEDIVGIDGYADLDDVLAAMKHTNLEQVVEVVENNDKRRFNMRQIDGKWQIRANQGHSIPHVLIDLKPLDPASTPIAYHGTTTKAYESIKTEGINRMQRQHVHLAKGLPGDAQVISGMRRNCQIVLAVDVCKAIEHGLTFYESQNGVVLCEGPIMPFLFDRVK